MGRDPILKPGRNHKTFRKPVRANMDRKTKDPLF